MALNLICNELGRLDLDNPEDLRRILQQDKHTRVEGLCSEVAFMEDVVQGNLDPVTSGFWFTRTYARYHVRKVITDVTVSLNDLDYRILDMFANAGAGGPVSIAYFNEQERTFYQFDHSAGRRYDSLEGSGTQIVRVANPVVANEAERDRLRIDKACSYLDQRGLLKDAAIKRLFANCWLGGYVWDIDAFTMTGSGQVVALEVKQKYPTNANTFGLNNGQRDLFGFLTQRGIPVNHIILQKPENNSKLHAIDLLTLPEYTERTRWLYTRFFPGNLWPAYERAPAHTSIFGGAGINYSHTQMNRFAVLKSLYVPADDVRSKLMAGIE